MISIYPDGTTHGGMTQAGGWSRGGKSIPAPAWYMNQFGQSGGSGLGGTQLSGAGGSGNSFAFNRYGNSPILNRQSMMGGASPWGQSQQFVGPQQASPVAGIANRLAGQPPAQATAQPSVYGNGFGGGTPMAGYFDGMQTHTDPATALKQAINPMQPATYNPVGGHYQLMTNGAGWGPIDPVADAANRTTNYGAPSWSSVNGGFSPGGSVLQSLLSGGGLPGTQPYTPGVNPTGVNLGLSPFQAGKVSF